ncbi:MAG: amidohydrolase family protein [Rhodospirillaceae bacterium]|mgnify:CR=1 FL=1|nr:amidohydrolase family protein [Rhodospirillaceae bacterium]MBT6205682.1 amidohydrolase family protein [Rhodospirillaceae bacterium]MBT7646752.1 amidohydrolase family protein [Rhodospirillaceae bacterium]
MTTLIRGCRPWGGTICDVLVRDGRIAERGSGLAAPDGATVIDGAGQMLLPGLVDAHTHLDKTLLGTPWHPHSAGERLIDLITNERRVLSELQLDPALQSRRMVHHMLERGTTRIRSHVDIGTDIALRHFHGVAETRETCADLAAIQIVAFPQTGMMILPGVADLMEQAVKEGAEVIGGLDPVGIDRDPRGQLDAVFAIAGRHGCEIDIHLHDLGEMGAITIEMMAERTAALGLKGKATVSHGFCLGDVDEKRLEGLIGLLLENDIAIATCGAGHYPIPPILKLRAAGVRMSAGSDGVRDAWGPLNNGDMLERAYQLAWHGDTRDDPGIETMLELATQGGAQAMGATDYGLDVGNRADLVLVAGETAAEAVCYHPPREMVMTGGRIVVENGVSLLEPI